MANRWYENELANLWMMTEQKEDANLKLQIKM